MKKIFFIIDDHLIKLRNPNGKLVQSPDLKGIQFLVSQLQTIIELVTKESEQFSGDSVLDSEEQIKKAERLVYQLVQICNKVTTRHEDAKEPEKVEKYMRYQTMQHVVESII